MKRIVYLLVGITIVWATLSASSLTKRHTEAKTSVPAISCVAKSFANMPVRTIPNFRQTKDWLRDFGVDVLNVSNRPIYFVNYLLVFPDLKGKHGPVAISFQYGRRELTDVTMAADRCDVPILPLGRVKLDLAKGDYEKLVAFVNSEGLPWEFITKADLVIQQVNFGDGTGWQAGYFLPDEPKNPKASFRSRVVNAAATRNATVCNDPCAPWKFIGWYACCGTWYPLYEDVGTNCYELTVVSEVCAPNPSVTCYRYMIQPCA